ncbi:MAG TPA: YHYH protein [Chitinophagales bacterium]|nr:YHYH protein [Chitinophagales bacterium]
MKTFIPLLFCLLANASFAQLTPEITSWIVNTTGETGFNSLPSNVQQVQYSTDNVYVSCTCIPGYDIGPWPGNPNTASNQNFVFKITRHPQANTGTLVNTPLGHIGVWTNGVSIFNAKDAFSYNSAGVWNQNAIFNEGASFDDCLGHPTQTGEYHHHLNPTCLYDHTDSSAHAPVIGYAFDGFPVYGAYGFADADGSGGVTRMKTSYGLRTIVDRTTLPDGTVLSAAQHGPAVNATNPLGKYIEDYEFVPGLGNLDEHNGRFCVTPDYPQGIYAYFVTIDANGEAVYPYTLGPTYYGTLQPGNTGPGSGHVTISEPVETYVLGVAETNDALAVTLYPNPFVDYLSVFVSPSFANNMQLELFNAVGQRVDGISNVQPAVTYSFDVSGLATGVYFLRLIHNERTAGFRVIKTGR